MNAATDMGHDAPIIDSDPTSLYQHLLGELDKLPLAYVQLMNAMFPTDNLPQYPRDVMGVFSPATKHMIIANGGYTRESGEAELEKGSASMISSRISCLPYFFGLVNTSSLRCVVSISTV